jgi:HTH-type transcriptional regulator/antitoxin MqsA
MKCPACGGAELVNDTRSVEYTYQNIVGQTVVTGDFCPRCKEVVLSWEEADHYGQWIDDFRQKVQREHSAKT